MATITIRKASEEDFGSIMCLVRACYGEAAEPPEWWRWRHQKVDSARSEMFVAADGEKIIGLRPMGLFNYLLQGRPTLGAMFSAVMVHPEYRRQGVFSRLVEACTQESWRLGAEFVHTMPNDVSYPGFMKLMWRDPGDRTLLVRAFDFGAIIGRGRGPRWVTSALAMLPNVALNIWQPPQGGDLAVEQVESFDCAAETMALEFAKQFDGLILQRTCRWLNWRFQSNPWNRYRRFVARSLHGEVIGIAVTNLEVRWGLLVGYLVEIVGDSSDARRVLIETAAAMLRQEGAALVATVASTPALVQDFRGQRFFIVPKRLSPKRFHTVYLPRPGSAEQFERVSRITAWYQTLADWDGI